MPNLTNVNNKNNIILAVVDSQPEAERLLRAARRKARELETSSEAA